MTLFNLHVNITWLCLCVCVCSCVKRKSFFSLHPIAGLPSVAPPTVRPLPRPDVTPPPHADVTLLYAQGQKIGALALNGTRLDEPRARTLLTLHVSDKRHTAMPLWIIVTLTLLLCFQGSIVVGLAYDCRENHVYWTDLSARTINRAAMTAGAEPEILINTSNGAYYLPHSGCCCCFKPAHVWFGVGV